MEWIFQETYQFEKVLQKINIVDKEEVVKQVNQMAEYFSNDKEKFFKHAHRAKITLRNGLEPSLYVIDAGLFRRVLFTIDDDPIFDQRIFTLLRLVKHDEYDKVLPKLAESLYLQYLDNYKDTNGN